MHTFLLVLEILFSIAIIVVVLMQPSKADGLKALMSGNSDTFFSKNKARTKEVMLARTTVILAVVLAVVTMLLDLIK
ncbi:preprotein translocase subunit SecG [Clostridium oryzae]|uniref:Protein-export membrane protein SecG n=1 Tax=Clostridium oryzae TaxID=1450648 RepID=A0A1V4ICC3_9CLOT|nr:preprotein translocase subunit SecG [Clostridium oryzae]OPJ57579.1 preprotein translocase subunit SecG [Clostridium oryzae]